MNIETIAVHSGRGVDPATGAVTPPIHMSTTFERAGDGSYPTGFVYGRVGNPTRNLLEECVRDLEGGAAAAAFSSGMAAIMSVFQALSAGGHVIAPQDIYHGTARLLRERFARWGLDSTFVDMTDIDQSPQSVEPFHQAHPRGNPFQSSAQDHRHPSCVGVGPRARYRLRVR